jgi:hypothetical protein
VKPKKHESQVGTVKMEASRRTGYKVRSRELSGLKNEPLDELAIEILKESPRIIPDMKETLGIIRKNASRLGISPEYEVRGSIDPEYPDLRKIWVWIHMGRNTDAERSVAIWEELTRLKLSKVHDASSIGKIVFWLAD